MGNLHERLMAALHVEALVLMDEARGYFDDLGPIEQSGLSPADRMLFSCESLKVTTRLMQVVGWLLSHGGDTTGERQALSGGGDAPVPLGGLPPTARRLILASRDLHDRVRRIDADRDRGDSGPAQALIRHLERAVGA